MTEFDIEFAQFSKEIEAFSLDDQSPVKVDHDEFEKKYEKFNREIELNARRIHAHHVVADVQRRLADELVAQLKALSK